MTFLPPYSTNIWKAIGIAAGLIVLLGFVLFAFDRCGTYSTNRDIEKRKANINAGLANIAKKEGAIANLKTEIAVEKAAANTATWEYMDNVNATNEVKVETDKALANLNAAKNANTTNSSVGDLERLMEKLK